MFEPPRNRNGVPSQYTWLIRFFAVSTSSAPESESLGSERGVSGTAKDKIVFLFVTSSLFPILPEVHPYRD